MIYTGFFSNTILFSIVQLAIIFFALFYTLNFRPTFSQVVIGISAIGLPVVLCYIYLVNWIGFIYFGVVTICYFYYYVRELRVLLDVFMLLIASVITATLLQLIEINLFSQFYNDSLFFMEGTILVNALAIIIYVFLFIIILRLYYKFIKKTWNLNVIPLVSQILFIIISFITVTIISLNLFVSLSDNLYYPALFNLIMQTVYFVIMFILFTFLLRNTKKQNMLNQKTTEQEQLFQYMQALERVNKDMQGFRHDYQNILLTMQGYMDGNDMSGLKTYFNDRIRNVESKTMQNNYIYNQLDNIKLIELKGMLSTKVLLAEEWGIDINVEVPDPIETVEMDIIDLTRIVGILMDNAIEASVEIEERQLSLAFLKTIDNAVLIILENRVNAEAVQIEALFAPDFSTKEDNQGIGLATLREILNEYPNITMNTRIENRLFIHELEINETVSQKATSSYYAKKMA